MFKIKNYKNFYLKKLYLLGLSTVCLCISTVHSHEMWIQPLNYSVKAGKKILANEIVGQNFKGNTYIYLESNYKFLNLSVGSDTKNIDSRVGDLPTIQEETNKEGLHIITAETTASELTYDTPEKFAKFLKQDGLEWVFAEHKKRGLPEKGFTEVYRRNPKTLVKVGHGKGQDKLYGLPLEWLVETNPYTSKGDIKVQLFWQGQPAAKMHVNVFNKPKRNSPNSELIKTRLTTDADGRVEIPRANGGLFLINSVKMIQPSAKTTAETGAVWESIWGSLSYEILLKI